MYAYKLPFVCGEAKTASRTYLCVDWVASRHVQVVEVPQMTCVSVLRADGGMVLVIILTTFGLSTSVDIIVKLLHYTLWFCFVLAFGAGRETFRSAVAQEVPWYFVSRRDSISLWGKWKNNVAFGFNFLSWCSIAQSMK